MSLSPLSLLQDGTIGRVDSFRTETANSEIVKI
jgi:hypothetical protein